MRRRRSIGLGLPTGSVDPRAGRSGRAQSRPHPRLTERGVALLLAVISIAILTVVGTEFAYNARVDLQLAANQRDELRAYYLARSGIGISRLLLRFQKQIDQVQLPNLGGLLSSLTGQGGAGDAASPGQTAPQPSSLSIQLWRMARVDCHMLQMMVPEGDESDRPPPRSEALEDADSPELALKMAQRSFGGFDGCFNAQITDEEERLNLNKFDAPQLTSRVVVERALDLFGDKRFEFLFEREDANKVKVAPADVVIAIRDWIDADEVQSSLNLSGQGEPFVKGFSDENYPYDRLTPRYRAKNALFDSLDELYLVHGVNDRFMAAFRDRLTVYPDVNSRLNVNTEDPLLLYMAILSVADPTRPDPRLQDPIFVDTVIQRIRTARLFSIFGMSVLDFLNIVESSGVAVNASIKNNIQNNRAVGDKSNTFRIRATGEAGSVTKTITTVVRADQGLGKLVYWREE